jgi:hypothetical protein
VAALTVAAPFLAFSVSAVSGSLDHPGGPRMSIQQVLELHGKRLLELPGVTGVGIGEQSGKPTIVIMLKNLTPDVKASLPQTLEGHTVFVEESGEIPSGLTCSQFSIQLISSPRCRYSGVTY